MRGCKIEYDPLSVNLRHVLVTAGRRLAAHIGTPVCLMRSRWTVTPAAHENYAHAHAYRLQFIMMVAPRVLVSDRPEGVSLFLHDLVVGAVMRSLPARERQSSFHECLVGEDGLGQRDLVKNIQPELRAVLGYQEPAQQGSAVCCVALRPAAKARIRSLSRPLDCLEDGTW